MYPEFDDWKTSIWEKAVWACHCSAEVLTSR